MKELWGSSLGMGGGTLFLFWMFLPFFSERLDASLFVKQPELKYFVIISESAFIAGVNMLLIGLFESWSYSRTYGVRLTKPSVFYATIIAVLAAFDVVFIYGGAGFLQVILIILISLCVFREICFACATTQHVSRSQAIFLLGIEFVAVIVPLLLSINTYF